jgi:hypothetical protein
MASTVYDDQINTALRLLTDPAESNMHRLTFLAEALPDVSPSTFQEAWGVVRARAELYRAHVEVGQDTGRSAHSLCKAVRLLFGYQAMHDMVRRAMA